MQVVRTVFASIRLTGIFLMFVSPLCVAAEKPLLLGVFPYLSGYAVVNKFAPLRDYLAEGMKQPLQVYTAPDFRTFIERTQRGEYDIVLTAPHLARMAILEADYLPLATYTAKLQAMILVRKDSPYARPADLRGKAVAIPDKLAVVSMLGEELLQEAGLSPVKDYQLVISRSHSSAALAVQLGRNDAAIIGSTPFKQLSNEVREDLRVLAQARPIATQYYIAHKRLGVKNIERLRELMVKFATSPAGAKFIEENRFEGIEPANGEDLKKLDPFVQEVKHLQESNDF